MDPISDMLTQIRNALSARKTEVVLPNSKFKRQLGELMARQGLVDEVATVERGKQNFLSIKLKYLSGKPAIGGITRVSRPGQRIYASAEKLPRTRSGYGMTIISTSKGLLTDQQARKEHLGGEIICEIW